MGKIANDPLASNVNEFTVAVEFVDFAFVSRHGTNNSFALATQLRQSFT